MIHQPDAQEELRRRLLAQSIAEEPLPSGYYHDYEEDGEDLIDLDVEGSVIQPNPIPPTPISVAYSETSAAALGDQASERTASPSRFQPEDDSVSTVADEVYEAISESIKIHYYFIISFSLLNTSVP